MPIFYAIYLDGTAIVKDGSSAEDVIRSLPGDYFVFKLLDRKYRYELNEDIIYINKENNSEKLVVRNYMLIDLKFRSKSSVAKIFDSTLMKVFTLQVYEIGLEKTLGVLIKTIVSASKYENWQDYVEKINAENEISRLAEANEILRKELEDCQKKLGGSS